MKIIINNKKALFNYQIIDKYIAGISLQGCEVKSIINAQTNLDQAFIILKKNEAFIINMYVAPWKQCANKNLSTTRNRKLLLNKHEILKIDLFLKRNSATVIPLNVFLSHNKIKLTIATAKRKNAHDKRQSSKENDLKREIKKFMK